MAEKSTDWAGLWVWVQLYGSLVVAWLLGEGARAVLSGAAGGLVRWFLDGKLRIRDGLVAVVCGIICAAYLSPVAERILEWVFGPLGPGSEGTAGFAAGLWGMSLAKVLMGIINMFSRRMNSGSDGDVA